MVDHNRDVFTDAEDDELLDGQPFEVFRPPSSRRPDPPPRVHQVARSFREDKEFSIRSATATAALEVKRELNSAAYYLRKWEGLDVRVQPYLSEGWQIDGVWYDAKDLPAEDLAAAGRDNAVTDHAWFTNFHAHKPDKTRGFAGMSKQDREAAMQRSAQSRGVVLQGMPIVVPRRRTTRKGTGSHQASKLRLASAARSVITSRTPGHGSCPGVLSCQLTVRSRPYKLVR